MAYNSRNHEAKVKFVMEIYKEWKKKRADIPDTRFVKHVLPQHGFTMSYTGFMNGYKHWFEGKGHIEAIKKSKREKQRQKRK
jgi:hypothetical protein